MNVSVVISTLDRCESLRKTLLSLNQQRYHDFEVVVVNGPSTDGTDELLAQWGDKIKVGRCPSANLSVSRNIGIAMAAGEIVAFIDDDAIPHPCWIGRIVGGYDRPDIGAVGGFVFDNTGFSFQTTYIVADRFGMADIHYPFDPIDTFNTPGGFRYAAHLGTNSSVRRSLLVSVGGFDEEFEYYLDETDLCARIVDRGYIVKIVPEALIHHKFAASHIRNSEKVLVRRYPVIKNQAYFALKHGRDICGIQASRDSIDRFVEDHRRQVLDLVARSILPEDSVGRFETEAARAVADGIARALARIEAPEPVRPFFTEPAAFKRYRNRNIASDRLTLCLLAETEGDGAVADLATRIAALGHTVHLLSPSSGGNLVDFDDGVWSHRVAVRRASGHSMELPASLWDRSSTLAGEVNRIANSDRIDAIYVPTSLCLAAGVLAETRIPVVAAIEQPIAARVLAGPPDFYSLVGAVVPELWWERRTIIFADGLSAPDIETIRYLERKYGVVVDRSRLVVHSPGHLDPASDVELVGLCRKLRCSDDQLPRRVLRPSAAPASSRQCGLSEFWLGAPLYSWMRRFSAGRVDWRLWAYCNMLKDMVADPSPRVLMLANETAPDPTEHIGPSAIRRVTGPTVTAGIEKARYEYGEDEFASVFCLLLVDLCDAQCVDVLIRLGRFCRTGGLIHITAAVGGPAEWHRALRDRLKQRGIDTEFDLDLLRGEPESRLYSDSRLEPYIYPEISGTPRIVAALRFRRNGSCA